MVRVSWTALVLRCAALALGVQVIGACGAVAPEGSDASPSDGVEPTGTATPVPGEFQAVDEYCAENPSEVRAVRAAVTLDGVVLTWRDGPKGPYELYRRDVGSPEWVPLARMAAPSETRYVDTVPRFGVAVEYLVANGITCESESGADLVTVPWAEGEDVTGGRPEFCEAWASPITDVSAQLVASGLLVEVTWHDNEDPPPGTAYLIYSRAPGAREWVHMESWVKYLADDDEPPSFLVPVDDAPAVAGAASSAFGVSRAAVCDPETLDGVTALVTAEEAEQD